MGASDQVNTKRLILSWRQALRGNVALPAALVGLLVGAAVVRWLGGTYAQLLMTVVVVGVGGRLVHRNLAAGYQFPAAVLISLAITAVWEACSLLLIWTNLRS